MHIAFVDSNPAGLAAIRLAKLAGHRVTFVQSSDPLYPPIERNRRIVMLADRLVDQVVTTDAAAVTAVLAAVHDDHPIDVATTQHEMSAEAVAYACRALGLRGTSPDGVFTARRKDRCRAALAQAGLPNARYALASSAARALAAAGEIGYPVVLKPPSGGDSLLSYVAGNAAQARAACAGILSGLAAVPPHWHGQFRRGILVEEFLSGTLVSVELGARDGEFFPFCVTGRFRWAEDEVVELGSFIPAALSAADADRCVEYAIDVCRAIGLDLGVFHLEIMVCDRGPVLVEVNPRTMGGALPTIYRHATGTDIYAGLLQVLTPGAKVDVPTRIAGCTGGRKVIARYGGVLSPDATLDAVAAHPDVLQVVGFDDYRTGPGQAVAPGEVVARFMLRGPDHASVRATALELMRDLQKSLGIALASGDKD
jgi:biotin carboxylase